MSRYRLVYVDPRIHRRLKALAVRHGRSMGAFVGDLVEREWVEAGNPWLEAPGLEMQQRALGEPWGDPALDVYGEA